MATFSTPSFRIRRNVHPSPLLLLSILSIFVASTASDASTTEEKTPLISFSNSPAAPPESAEARMALRQHRPVSALNRYTFHGNVFEGVGDHVDSWIVMFCPGWHDKCQGLLPSYELLGVQWENKQNKESVMSSKVRFAKVDCATDKQLCVSLDIDDYPSVVHYRNNQRVNSWHGGAPGLVRFVKQELEGPKKRRAAPPPKAKSPSTCTMDDAPDPKKVSEQQLASLLPMLHLLRFATSPWRSLCFAFMLLAATRAAWDGVCRLRSGIRALSPSDTKPKKTTASHEQQHAASPSVQACLPQEWAREREAIEL